MTLPSRLSRPTSAIALAALALLCLGAAARAQTPPGRSLLLFPVRSHWLSAPLADSATAALAAQLRDAGFTVIVARPDSPAVRRAVSEGWLEPEALEADGLFAAQEPLAAAVAANAWLIADLSETETEAVLHGAIAGTVSRKEVGFEAGAPIAGGQAEIARALAAQVAAGLTDALWPLAGADPESARLAALDRYAAGRAALAQGMYRDAVIEFETALLADPDDREYLWFAAEARAARGDNSGAMALLRRLAGIPPADLGVLLKLGDFALLGAEPAQAEAAFLGAHELAPDDPRAIEGVARAARARGDFARSESYYAKLLPLIGLDYRPTQQQYVHVGGSDYRYSGLRQVITPGQQESLPATLAHLRDDSILLTGIPPEEVYLQLSRAYLRAGHLPAALQALTRYHAGADRRPYTDDEYADVFAALDEQSEGIARGAQMTLAARALGQLDDEQADAEMEALHSRSDELATLAERMQVSPGLDPAHRYRVLSYNLLNQSNFEAVMFLRTGDADRKRRAELLREASRKARTQANQLLELLWGAEGARRASPGPPPEWAETE